MIGSARSINNVLIRLTEERWTHIIERHTELTGKSNEVLETIENPDTIYKGTRGELITVCKKEHCYFAVMYREGEQDGFVITAFFMRRLGSLQKRKIIWSKQS